MNIACHYAGLTDRGLVREQNEDAWSAQPNLGLFLVSDGMGGEAAGEVAANAVADALPALIRMQLPPDRNLEHPATAAAVADIVAQLSDGLREEANSAPHLQGMGATLVAALIGENAALIVHMGDSRAYLLHGGCLSRLTADHTFAEYLVASGDISAREAQNHPGRHQLTRHMGMTGEARPDTRLITLEAGDLLLLCSDGLTGMIDEERIQETLQTRHSLEEACAALVAMAKEAGGHDNITVLLIRRDAEPESHGA